MYAIFETGGKQYKVEKGSTIFVEKLDAQPDEIVTFNSVLLYEDSKKQIKTGSPYISSTLVAAKVVKQGKGKKLTVFTYKPKKDSRRKLGHRQPYTKLEIISMGTTATVNKAIKALEEKVETVQENSETEA